MHRKRPFEVARDFRQHALLRGRRLERQNPLQRLAHLVLAHAHRDSALPMVLRAPQRQRDLVVEKLLEDQPDLRRAAKGVQQLDVFFLSAENGPHSSASRRVGKRYRSRISSGSGSAMLPSKFTQHAVDDPPQHPRADRPNRLVDRDDAPHFGRIRGGRAVAAQNLDLRIHHLDAPRPVRVDLRLAVHHQPLPFLEPPFEIRAVKKSRVQLARGVAHRHVKHRPAPAAKPHRAAAAARHFSQNRVYLPRNNFRDLREANAVLVAKRQIPQQVADGHDSALLERRRALRPHPAQVFHRIVEVNGHHSGTDDPAGTLTHTSRRPNQRQAALQIL